MSERDVGPRVGADPELFICNLANEIIPACGMVGGTKHDPLIVNKDIVNLYGTERTPRGGIPPVGNYAIQEDNVMLEFNIPAYGSANEFIGAVSKMMYFLENSVLGPKNLRLRYGVVDHAFKETVLAKHPQSQDIGCTPDFTAYPKEDGRFERTPYSAMDLGNRRFCGGHLHVQYDAKLVPPHVFSQFMDCVVCLPYLSLDRQKGRRLFYGQPGLFRVKPYGIEYRTLSSFWLEPDFRERHLLEMIDNVLALARTANNQCDALKKMYSNVDWDDVAEIIRNEDSKKAVAMAHSLREMGLYINTVVGNKNSKQ